MRQKADIARKSPCLSVLPAFFNCRTVIQTEYFFILQNCGRKELHILDIFQTGGTEQGATPGILLGFALLFSIMLYSESKK
jgi:hypothetical protein